MSAHDNLKKTALAAVRDIFHDTSVPKDKTRETLEEVRTEIDELLSTL